MKIDSLYNAPLLNDSAIRFHSYLLKIFVNDFKDNVVQVKDEVLQTQLIEKFDKIYILMIDK